MFYLTTHSTHFIYGYMASDIWLRTILIVRKETRCHHIGYSFRLAARVLLYAPSHRQDNTYILPSIYVAEWEEANLSESIKSPLLYLRYLEGRKEMFYDGHIKYWVTLSSPVYRRVTRYLREIRIYEPNRLGRN